MSLGSGNSSRLQETFSQFKIDIVLTEKGMKEYEEVIRLVFAYLNKLLEEGAPQQMYEEMKVYDHLRFTFMTPAPAKLMAKSLAARLNGWDGESQNACAIDDIIYQPFANLNFRKDTILQFL